MSPLPDDHQAARELQREFERLGRERAAARAGAARTTNAARRRWRIALAALASTLAAAAVAAAATSLFVDDAPVDEPAALPPELERAPRDLRLSSAQVPDPGGGALPWGAQTYTNERGLPCVRVGNVKDGVLGVVRDGRFAPYGRRAPGACAALRRHYIVSVRVVPAIAGGRSIVYGVVDREVERVALERGGRRDELPIAPDGVFLHVAAGVDALRGVTFVANVGGRVERSPTVR